MCFASLCRVCNRYTVTIGYHTWVGRSGRRAAWQTGARCRRIRCHREKRMIANDLAELDRPTWPEVRDQIVNFTHDGALGEPRSYPGYPSWSLVRCWARPWPSLENTLVRRRT